MSDLRSKTSRVRLDGKAYRELQRHILQRDSWRCQICGRMQQLQIHHLKFRSQGGSDSEQNLITLCAGCHEKLHRPTTGQYPSDKC